MKILFPPIAPYFYSFLKQAKSSVTLIAPYIKYDTSKKIYEIIGSKKIRLTLITNCSVANFLSGSSDIEALEIFCKLPNVKIYSITNVHSKVYLFDDHLLLITSANLTQAVYQRIWK